MIMAVAVVSIIAVSLGIGFIATVKAPLGYEDSTGFHFGRQEGTPSEIPFGLPKPELA